MEGSKNWDPHDEGRSGSGGSGSSGDSSSDRLYSGKYAEYFSTMNPLAARIYQDINKVEDKVEGFGALSYDEKCSVIDSHLLFNTNNGNINNGNGFYGNPLNGQVAVSHTAAMLMSVCPKKDADDNSEDGGGCGGSISSRFTTCKIGACNLGKMLKNVTLLTKKPLRPQRSSMSKKHKAPAPTKPISMIVSLSKTSNEDFASESRNQEEKKEMKNHEFSNGNKLIKKAESYYEDEFENEQEDRLPQQKQNVDLITELQAKLKKKGDEGIWTGNSPVLKHQILKPKAPPPPPPVLKKMDAEIKSGEKENYKQVSREDEFLVDVSSPCRIATPKTGFDFLDNW